MAYAVVRRLPCLLILVLGYSARGQTVESSAPEGSGNAGARPPTSSAMGEEAAAPAQSGKPPISTERSLLDWLRASLSQDEDPDGPINTDRPTFTPANTVVPLGGGLQFESGFTFNNNPAGDDPRHSYSLYDLPELAMRDGLFKRVEFRTFWQGQTWTQMQPRPGGPSGLKGGGLSDMEVGFKWQLLTEDKDRKWVPTTALITSVFAPTRGTLRLLFANGRALHQSHLCLEPDKEADIRREHGIPHLHQRVQPFVPGAGPAHRQLRAVPPVSGSVLLGGRTDFTLFYEWYILMLQRPWDKRPTHFMDGGVLYRLSPNMQLDLRPGFGLSGHPDDFFLGLGLLGTLLRRVQDTGVERFASLLLLASCKSLLRNRAICTTVNFLWNGSGLRLLYQCHNAHGIQG